MALLEKGVPHTLEFIDITCGENYEPWFVKLNPACEVPVLRDGTRIVSGSQKIIDYLEDNFVDGKQTEVGDIVNDALKFLGYVALSPEKSSIEFHKMRYLRDAIDAVPVEFITYGFIRHPDLTEKIKVPDFVKKNLGGEFPHLMCPYVKPPRLYVVRWCLSFAGENFVNKACEFDGNHYPLWNRRLILSLRNRVSGAGGGSFSCAQLSLFVCLHH